MSKRLYSVFLILVFLVCTPIITFAAENPDSVSFGASVGDCSIKTQFVNGTEYLFLPSGADCSSIKLHGLADNATITVNDFPATNAGDIWNLGKVESGMQYVMKISSKDNPDAVRTIILMKASGISSLFVTGDKGIEYLNSDKNNISESGTVVKLSANGDVLVNTALSKIKGRGHTTWTGSKDKNTNTDKKPYNLTTRDEVQLISDANSKEKKWTLLSGSYNDYSGLMNTFALNLYKQINGNAYVDCEPINFYYNGEYRGLYVITDKVEVDSDLVDINKSEFSTKDEDSTTRYICKDYDSYFNEALTNNQMWSKAKENAVEAPSDDRAINAGILAYSYATNSSTTAEGGILFEISHQYYDEACWFITNRGVMISLKSPEYATQKQVQDIAIYVQDFENALMCETGFNSKGKHYTEYIDINSLAKSFLLNCFTSQNDFFDCSEFFYIDGNNSGFSGKLKSGPAWDYDVSHYGYSIYSTKSAEGLNGRRIWLRQLLTKGDFVTELHNLQKGTFASALDVLSNEVLESYTTAVKDSAITDQAMWLYSTTTVDKLSLCQQNISSRLKAWESIWSDKTNALRGVYIKEESGTIISSSSGASRYQWYKLTDDYTMGEMIPGATGSSYIPTSPGIYYVRAYGNALAGNNVYTMFSNPVVYDYGASNQPESTIPFNDISSDDYYYDAVLWATEKNITKGASETSFAPDAECNRAQMTTFLWRASGCPEPSTDTCTFVDINEGNYCYKAVLWAVENGITTGTSDNTFSPNQIVNRAQAVTFISRLSNAAAPKKSNHFIDVAADSYYSRAVQWAVENGITTGTSDNTFSPDNSCTRGQIVTFLYRFFRN